MQSMLPVVWEQEHRTTGNTGPELGLPGSLMPSILAGFQIAVCMQHWGRKKGRSMVVGWGMGRGTQGLEELIICQDPFPPFERMHLLVWPEDRLSLGVLGPLGKFIAKFTAQGQQFSFSC